ncbi:MAG: helix-turn-helix domain-containing protein [Saprospiraceae bacterium]
MKDNSNITTFEEHLTKKYGHVGTAKRDAFEHGFEAFKLGVLIEEARRNLGLTQQQLADRTGTTKNYISRIEHDASDIRLSTLLRIVQQGLGGKLVLSFQMENGQAAPAL